MPLQCETLAHRGVGQLIETVHDVARVTNPRLTIAGILPTMYDGRTSHARAVLADIYDRYEIPVLDPPIARSVRFAEAPALGRSALATSSHLRGVGGLPRARPAHARLPGAGARMSEAARLSAVAPAGTRPTARAVAVSCAVVAYVALAAGGLSSAVSAEASSAVPTRTIVAGSASTRCPGSAPSRRAWPSTVPAALTPAAVRPAHGPLLRLPLPAGSGSGRRIVYSEGVPQHAWIVDASGRVLRDFPVSGRADWPRPGTYRVYSRSAYSNNPAYHVTFRWMVRFTIGHSAAIGFHSIPRYYDGRPMQTVASSASRSGAAAAPHSADADAAFVYRWAGLGTTVVVVR